MANVAGKAYAMNVLTPVKPWRLWVNRFIFMFSRVLPSTLGGLLGLKFIHFARWVFIRRKDWPDYGQPRPKLRNDYVLFCSNFNGTWDQYIDAFSDGIPNGLNLFWYSSTKYPGSVPITPFKHYIRHNQLTTDYYYNATPGSAQRDIKNALKLLRLLRELEGTHATADPDGFAKAYVRAMNALGHGLPAAGFAPEASRDTVRAEECVAPRIKARWGEAA